MKKMKILFWITTGLISLMMLFSAYSYLTTTEMEAAFQHLGYPDYFRVELAVAKIVGVILLLIPAGFWIKEWVYGGFFITFVSAIIAHLSVGDPISVAVMPLVALVLLVLSYFSYKRIQNSASYVQFA